MVILMVCVWLFASAKAQKKDDPKASKRSISLEEEKEDIENSQTYVFHSVEYGCVHEPRPANPQ